MAEQQAAHSAQVSIYLPDTGSETICVLSNDVVGFDLDAKSVGMLLLTSAGVRQYFNDETVSTCQ